jgi:hypothetical protein
MTPDRAPAALAGCTDIGPRTGPHETKIQKGKISGGAGGARTHDRRIMRSTASCTTHATCTDGAGNRTDGTHHAAIIWRAGPRTGPRPNAMDLSVFDVVGVTGAGGGREAVLITERDVAPWAVVARAWR